MSHKKIDEQILNIKKNSINRTNDESKNIKHTNNRKESFKPENNKFNLRTVDIETQTLEDEIECYEESVQTKIRKEKETQTDFREILQKENKQYNDKRLQSFLERSLVLVEEALNSREDEEFECRKKIFKKNSFVHKIFNIKIFLENYLLFKEFLNSKINLIRIFLILMNLYF